MRFARLGLASIALLAPILGLPASSQAQNGFYLKDGDRVVFYGDSITEQRLYTTLAETFAVTRFPKANLSFIHSGWGGDRVTGGGGGPIDLRLTRDVEAYKPTVVTIMLGMNDASYQPFRDPTFNTFSTGYTHIVDKLKADIPGVRLTLIKPSPYDDVTRAPKFEDGYNNVLIRYGDFIRTLATKSNADFADLNTSVVAATVKAFESDPKLAEKLNPDRVHPGPGGQLLMAAALLKAWNAPAIVSNVAIDAQQTKVNTSENASITNLKREGEVVTWTQLDEALPFPIDLKDPATELAVRSSDIIASLDRQIVKVEGLTAENSTLAIDGEDVGTFTKAQLAEGINLATLNTPMLKQAVQVHALTLKHNTFHSMRWRTVQVPSQKTKIPAALAKTLEGLDELEAEIVAEQHATAQPKPHTFEIKPKS